MDYFAGLDCQIAFKRDPLSRPIPTPRGVTILADECAVNQDEDAPPLVRRREGAARLEARQRRRVEDSISRGPARDTTRPCLAGICLRSGF